jgi:methionyl-tRNA synthetase
MSQRLLITSALPYANGPLHLGHMVEHVMTDVWARYQRLAGRRVLAICGDDTHGTAIMIRARKEGRSEEALIAEMAAAHQRDFVDFDVRYDHYGSTHAADNRRLCHEIWASLRAAGAVSEREVRQLFDPVAGTFLADRFVKGTCPSCKSPDQYGDGCEVCGTTYAPTELIDPQSTLSGAAPELSSAPHWFIGIERHREFLRAWSREPGRLQPEIANFLDKNFLGDVLRDWDVSRPAPYFGFEIPDAPGHYWYVWFDAPIGYMAATAEWCAARGQDFDAWWRSPDTAIHHVIGKDIVYFHTLFWPSMLKSAGYSLPSRVQVHGFLTVNGEKMSKSRGTFVLARTYLEAGLDPQQLRYYFASKLTSEVTDLDWNLSEFVSKVNSDLVGKVVNLASRSARFVPELADAYPDDGGLFAAAAARAAEIGEAYASFDTARAMRTIMALADRANEYVDREQPWALKKDPAQAERLRAVVTVTLNLFRQLAIYLAPVLPRLAEEAGALLGEPITRFDQAQAPLLGAKLARFEHLMQRVDPQRVEAMIEASKPRDEAPRDAAPVAPSADDGAALAAEPLASECSIDDFGKVDLRVARVVSAEAVPKADKLLKLRVDLGGGVERQIFAGIKGAYAPEALVGRLVIVVANLAPRQMKFGLSEGMVVAAGPPGKGEKQVFLLAPDSGASPGQRVH